MRRFGANYIFPVNKPPIRNGIIETDNNGKITRIFEPDIDFQEIHSTSFFNGVIVPGFINAHCHLELSHLKGLKPSKPGIAGFIEAVTNQRDTEYKKNIEKSISNAINQAYASGTAAIADICNTPTTIPHKLNSNIQFLNFIELFGINPSASESSFSNGLSTYSEFKKVFPDSTYLTPHSTYSLSENLWKLISNHISEKRQKLLSIHYGESKAEYEFLTQGSGPLFERYKKANIPFDVPKELNPYSITTRYLTPQTNLLTVHNTFAEPYELMKLSNFFAELTLVTCPESNLIIENTLPPLDKFKEYGFNISIGTDSLASASSLSVLEQIKLILKHFRSIEFHSVLRWATYNGAKALHIENQFGTIEVGKQPGLVLIDNFDFSNMRPSKDSVAKRLI